jgi:hypothetical protein
MTLLAARLLLTLSRNSGFHGSGRPSGGWADPPAPAPLPRITSIPIFWDARDGHLW